MTQIVSSSSVVLLHDLSNPQFIQPQPKVTINSHMPDSRVNCVAFSYKNLIIASGADDGKLVLSNLTGQKIQSFSSYTNKIIPVNSIQFSNSNEFLAAGLADGFVKLWDLKKKDVVRTFKPTNYTLKSSITSINFNQSNDLLGASNNKGYINIFPVSDIMKNPNTVAVNQTPVQEILTLKQSDSSINQFKFSPFLDNMVVGAQDDGLLTIFDLPTQKGISQLKNHTASVKGISFSPLNKLLLSSASLDKQIIFYDVQQKTKVSSIKTDYALQSISFNTDGHTVAAGTSTAGLVLVYDLRNSGQPLAILEGHKSTVSSVSFKNSDTVKSSSSSNQLTNQKQLQENQPKKISSESSTQQITAQFKTMEQIREEARKNVDLKKKQRELQKQQILEQQQQSDRDTESVRSEIQMRGIFEQQFKDLDTQDQQQQQYKQLPQISLFDKNSGNLESKSPLGTKPPQKNSVTVYNQQSNIQIDDVDMRDDYQQHQKNNNSPQIHMNDLQVNLNDEYREEISLFIGKKMEEIQSSTQQMLNNFQIEIIRQFELQRNQIDSIISEYLIEDDGESSDGDSITIEEAKQDDLQEDEEFNENYLN